MFSRTVRKSVLDVKIPSSILPPAFLLPSHSRLLHATAQYVEPSTEAQNIPQTPPPAARPSKLAAYAEIFKQQRNPLPKSEVARAPLPPKPLSESTKQMLPLLVAQPNHFITAHIHAKPYLVTVGDVVRLPFHMPHVVPGDVLRLNRATALGSREYTLKGAPYIDERIFECRATVMGADGEPARVKVVKKQRNRRTKTIISKHKFTLLRISELRVKPLAEIEA
jgi:large subunit ribosomal protein L21